MKNNKVIYWTLLICLLFSLIGCNGDDETPTVPIDEFDLTSCDLSDLIYILENVGPQGAIINITNCTYEVNNIHNAPSIGYGTYNGVGLPPIEVPVTINGMGDVTFTRGVNSEFLRFFYVTETGELYLNSINLENGYLPLDGENNKGGAILNLGGRVELTDCELVNNIANTGGAIYNYGGVLELWNTTLSDNMAEYKGGAITSTEGGIIYAEESIFLRNQSNQQGGAIYNQGLIQIENNTQFQFNTAAISGGAIIHLSDTTLQITDAAFSDNTAGRYGGAISIGGTPDHLTTIQNCIFENNIAGPGGDSVGGAIKVSGGRLNIHSGSQLINNQADWGGAVYISATDLSISASILENNHADVNGGAVWIGEDTTATFAVSSIVNNVAENSGGGILNQGTTTIDRTTIDQNHAVLFSAGGIDNALGGKLTIMYSTISNNTSAGSGGGIFNGSLGNLIIFNSTISGNQGTNGSAIYNSGQVNLSHSTIAFNYTEFGKAVFSDISGGAINVKNTIIANNTGGWGYTSNCQGIVAAIGDNLDDDGTCYFYINDDPRLSPLANNGGDTLTHEILFLSPARDAVTDCTDIGGSPVVDMDQREISRPQDDACDIGAYEREAMLAPLTPPISTVVFLQNSSCRERPGSEYHVTGFFNSGDTAEVVGRNPNLTWFQVMIPDSESKCWVWKELVTFTGEIEALPIIAPEVSEIAPEAAEVSGQDEAACQPPDGGCPYKEAPTCWDGDTCSCVPCE